ncbi:hypothetical protein ACIPPR_13360 [Streptomyces nigra]
MTAVNDLGVNTGEVMSSPSQGGRGELYVFAIGGDVFRVDPA